MKNIYIKLILLTVVSLAVFSCDEDKTTYDALNFPEDAFVALETSNLEVLESTTTPIEIVVNYSNTFAGATTDISVDFSITSDNATEGVHYTIADNKSQLNFPKGTFVDKITIIPIDNVIEDGDKILNFTIVSAPVTVGYPGPNPSGTSITITLTDDDCAFTLADLDGVSWVGTDNATGSQGPNPTQVTTSFDGTNLLMNGLAFGWLTSSYWGEVIVADAPLIVNMNPVTGQFTIAEQYLADATWNGSPQPTYSIKASGQYFSCLKKMVINYDLIQDGGILRSFTETIEF